MAIQKKCITCNHVGPKEEMELSTTGEWWCLECVEESGAMDTLRADAGDIRHAPPDDCL